MSRAKPTSQPSKKRKFTHDGYFRENFEAKRLGKAFLRKVLPKQTLASLDLGNLAIERRDRTDDELRGLINDVIYRVPIKKTKKHIHFFAILDHKSGQDFQTIFQLWVYVYLICRQEYLAAKDRDEVDVNYQLPPVVVIIIYHGRSKFRGKTELAEMFFPLPGLEPYLPRLQAILFDLSTINDDDPVLNDPDAPELKVVLMVLKIVFRQDVLPKLKDILAELKPYSDNPEMRRVIRTTYIYLANNAKHLKRNEEVLFHTFKEVIGEKTMLTMIEKLEAKARAEGEARERVKARAEMTLELLRKKFHKVPQRIEKAIQSMTDPTALDSLAVHILDSQSLKEFEEALN